jgi:choline kinase
MRAIILAAGRGRRINQLSKLKPKCFIKVNNKSLINYQIEALKKAGIKKIAIITGYKKNFFQNLKTKKFNNKEWRSTNMIYSLCKAQSWLSKYKCIICYSDIFFETSAIKLLKKNNNEFCVLSYLDWKNLWKKRFKNIKIDIESFKINKSNYITNIGQKVRNINDIQGQFMGVFKLSPPKWKIIIKYIKELDKNQRSKMSTTSLINNIINMYKLKIKAVFYKDLFFEIDNYKDYKILLDVFKKKHI